jgi:predicted transcriptional regulator
MVESGATGTGAVDAVLKRVDELANELSRTTAELDLAVCRARDAGASWREIAERLGCTPQAAHKRYRWARHNIEGQVWHEPPLPWGRSRGASTER